MIEGRAREGEKMMYAISLVVGYHGDAREPASHRERERESRSSSK